MEKISEVGGHGSGVKEYDKWAPTVDGRNPAPPGMVKTL